MEIPLSLLNDLRNSMTSSLSLFSRANTGSRVDVFSDYDIELYVLDIQSFMNDEWLSFFARPMIRWPFKPMPTHRRDWITRLVIFENEVRIDFQRKVVQPLRDKF